MFTERSKSVISNRHERKDGRFSDIDMSVVDESCAFH
jgi:hypothetical protein